MPCRFSVVFCLSGCQRAGASFGWLFIFYGRRKGLVCLLRKCCSETTVKRGQDANTRQQDYFLY